MRSTALYYEQKHKEFTPFAEFRGNGSQRRIYGIEITRTPEYIRLYPISTKGTLHAIFMDIPLEKVDLLIEELRRYRNLPSAQI